MYFAYILIHNAQIQLKINSGTKFAGHLKMQFQKLKFVDGKVNNKCFGGYINVFVCYKSRLLS